MFRLAYNKQKTLCRYYARKTRNPGIDRRATLLPDNARSEEYNSLDDGEADFHQVHKSHKQFEAEQAQYRDRLQTWIVGNKYFKSKQLNFLTWAEKEQIRYLYSLDPDEWNIDKLTESFPADRYTIAKIVKTKWQPKGGKRMERHDAIVQENWQMFRSGRIRNLDPGFAQHLNKFMQRTVDKVNELQATLETKPLYEIRPLPQGEFTAIVTSCKKYQSSAKDNQLKQSFLIEDNEQSESSNHHESPRHFPKQDTFMMGNVRNTQHVTLAEIKRQEDPTFTVHRKSSADNLELDLTVAEKLENNNVQCETVAFADSVYDSRAEKQECIKEFIKIPKRLYRKGATYQMDDCFYDDDGEFLYRVPGLGYSEMLRIIKARVKLSSECVVMSTRVTTECCAVDNLDSMLSASRDNADVTLIWQNLTITPTRNVSTGVQHPVLNDISGTLLPGTLVALMGPSGAGKTTLMSALAFRISGENVRRER
uniref:ABC transporter domain-containing protein n=1 Tax=Anopheles culicifacies TaxID=139723 RepID=A0A182MIG0_9DIPT